MQIIHIWVNIDQINKITINFRLQAMHAPVM